jgi:flagellar basal body-associated protein FliL
MAEEAKADAKAEAKAEAPAGPKMIMGLPIVQVAFYGANALVMLGALGYIVYVSLIYKKPPIMEAPSRTEITKREEAKLAAAGDGYFPVNFPEQLVTLRSAQGGKIHYCTVETTIVCGSETCEAQMKELKPKVQDAVQSIIAGRSYTELGSLDAKFRIKHEVLSRVNAELKNTAALDVLFTSFTVQ